MYAEGYVVYISRKELVSLGLHPSTGDARLERGSNLDLSEITMRLKAAKGLKSCYKTLIKGVKELESDLQESLAHLELKSGEKDHE